MFHLRMKEPVRNYVEYDNEKKRKMKRAAPETKDKTKKLKQEETREECREVVEE